MLSFDALSELPGGEVPATGARVPVVHADQANFAFDGAAYTYPPQTAVDFSWQTSSANPEGDGAVTFDSIADASAAHGVAGDGSASLSFDESADGEFTSVSAIGDGAATLDVSATADASHGVAGDGAASLDLAEGAAAAHGIAGDESAVLSFSVAADGAHGIAGDASTTITFAADAQAVHERYEVKGEVRQSGVLVNRRVRVYLRTSGALIGENDTSAGKFRVHTGFTPEEHYIVSIHLDDAASDYNPPVENRVVSVLAQDV